MSSFWLQTIAGRQSYSSRVLPQQIMEGQEHEVLDVTFRITHYSLAAIVLGFWVIGPPLRDNLKSNKSHLLTEGRE